MTAPSLRLATASNFRDLAEPIRSLPLRRGTLYRSDHLGALTPDDCRQIQALGVKRVLDFRGVDERCTAVCALPDVSVHSLPIEPTIVQTLNTLLAAGQRVSAADVGAYMQDTYRGFVRHNTPRFAEFFTHLLASNEPTVFHCTAGKDRTGFAAALLLRALGAPEEEVLHDYLLTNERLAMPSSSRHGLPREVMEVLWRVQPDFLSAAFDEVESSYGSIQAYLREGLGVREAESERLRALYLAS